MKKEDLFDDEFLKQFKSGVDLYGQLNSYFKFYNHQRRHQGIENEIPINLYQQEKRKAA